MQAPDPQDVVFAGGPVLAALTEQACVGAAREGGRPPDASLLSFTWGVFC